MNNILSQLREIDTFIFDVDGVFTDGRLLVSEEGFMLRVMNAKDGFAVKYALNQGYNIVIITGGRSKGVASRFEKLGVREVHIDVPDKIKVLQEVQERINFDLSKSIYMGDDIPDLEVMKMVHFPCCPSDAVQEIKQISKFISTRKKLREKFGRKRSD